MNELTVAFLGDLYVAHNSALPEVSPELVEFLEACDHVVANLEGPITPATKHIAKDPWPVMRQPAAVLDLLETLSVDVAGLANNHLGDYGPKGIQDTRQLLRQHGVRFAGAGLSAQEVYKPVRVSAGDVCVSLLFGGDRHFGCACDDRHEGSGYAWLFAPVFIDMLRSEAAECDHAIVVAHAGAMNIDRPLPQLRKFYKHLVDSGATAVIGHHPHRAQGVEVYNGVPIFYSIGNFYFTVGKKPPEWFVSQIPVLKLGRRGHVTWRVEHSRYEMQGTGGRVLLDDSADYKQRTHRLSAELKDSTYERLLVDDLQELWRTRYSPVLSPAVKTVPSVAFLGRAVRRFAESVYRRRNALSRPVLLQAFLECESDRWALEEILRTMYEDNWET